MLASLSVHLRRCLEMAMAHLEQLALGLEQQVLLTGTFTIRMLHRVGFSGHRRFGIRRGHYQVASSFSKTQCFCVFLFRR